jgi:putative salt-induced outer membrane protein
MKSEANHSFRLVLLLFCWHAALTQAQEQEEKPADEGSASVGYVGTTGNTESQTLETQLRYVMRRSDWAHNFDLQGLYAEQDEEVNGERYYLQVKSDYEITEDDYAFVKASYTDDRFTGFSYQATVSLGYGHYFYNRDELTLEVFSGLGYRYNELPEATEDADSEKEAIVTLGENFKWAVSENVRLTQSLTSEVGEELTVSRFELGLVSTLIGDLATKIAFQVRHISEVPPDRENTDTQTSVSLVYEF